MTKGRARALALAALLLAVGCGRATQERWTSPPDPFRPVNKAFFGFNMGVDRYVAQPVSAVYRGVTPKPLRAGIRNFFRNLSMPIVIANDVLQGRPRRAGRDALRFLTNSTVGFGGIADPATTLGLEFSPQNFGVTAGRWGMGPGPYLVLPFLGPTSVTGLPDIPMRLVLSPVGLIGPGLERTATAGVNAVSTAESRREAMRRVREAVAPYEFMKSGYMQRQWSLISGEDESAPFEPLPEDLLEDDADTEPSADPEPDSAPPEQAEPGAAAPGR
ncbi:MAG: VacJ family lipoprotein [Planctomycetota bacterium]|nr:MAG: VacJ family lipoprotein [Planctomycetota bacterium]